MVSHNWLVINNINGRFRPPPHFIVRAGRFLEIIALRSRPNCSGGLRPPKEKAERIFATVLDRRYSSPPSRAGSINWMPQLNKEGQSDYLEKAASDFLHLTNQGRHLDRCLALSFTWEENHRFTNSIREGLRERGVLPAEGTSVQVHESLR